MDATQGGEIDGDADGSLLARLADAVGCATTQLRWHFVGNPRGPCRVWEVTAGGVGEGVIVKQFQNDRAFAQERHVYEAWLPRLDAAPRLLAARPAPVRALLLRKLPGAPLATTHAGASVERAAHRRAGQFLRALHALPEADPDPVPLARALPQRYAAWLARADPFVAPGERARLRELGGALAGDLFAAARRVPCHRDFTPHNWLVAGPTIEDHLAAVEDFAVIDFEHAHLDAPMLDLVKLWTDAWVDRHDLETAFFSGYGRTLADAERQQLGVLAAMHAMATLAWAHEHRDPTFVALGHKALRRALA
jgi:hypothetical protein